MDSSIEVVRVHFEDGTSQDWTSGPGIQVSTKAVAEFLRICMQPTPAKVEVLPSETSQV